jgi:hypothetical protein
MYWGGNEAAGADMGLPTNIYCQMTTTLPAPRWLNNLVDGHHSNHGCMSVIMLTAAVIVYIHMYIPQNEEDQPGPSSDGNEPEEAALAG